jgi:predicted alpha-1,6-mannanase (GH76 family)
MRHVIARRLRARAALLLALVGVLILGGMWLFGGRAAPPKDPSSGWPHRAGALHKTDSGQLTEHANEAQDVLVREFWDAGASRFRIAAPPGGDGTSDEGSDGNDLMYWWQAQALDVLLDRQERDPSAANRARIVALIDGVRRANGNRMPNSYYDDMEWMALALLRADSLGIRTMPMVRELWRVIRGGWNGSQGGGIAWRTNQLDYKNVPANAPAAILAARLYARDRHARDLRWAKQLVDYIHRTFIDPETLRVYDGINRQGDGRLDRDWTFSYNVGVVVGADLELSNVTGDQTLRARALKVARANLPTIAPHGVLGDEGDSDGALFRGIAARYLVQLADAEIDDVLTQSGGAAWQSRNGAGRFGGSWSSQAPARTELGAQVSATMLLEQLARTRPD